MAHGLHAEQLLMQNWPLLQRSMALRFGKQHASEMCSLSQSFAEAIKISSMAQARCPLAC